jgi:hypothetical protein
LAVGLLRINLRNTNFVYPQIEAVELKANSYSVIDLRWKMVWEG